MLRAFCKGLDRLWDYRCASDRRGKARDGRSGLGVDWGGLQGGGFGVG
jgi:hypothetical protein